MKSLYDLTLENNRMLNKLLLLFDEDSIKAAKMPRPKSSSELTEQVGKLTEQGYSKAQIASMLGVSTGTVGLKRKAYKAMMEGPSSLIEPDKVEFDDDIDFLLDFGEIK